MAACYEGNAPLFNTGTAMAQPAAKHSPPYSAYSSFMNFINGLRETGVPPRIDRSVFGNASGSLIYSTLAALKSLKLIEEDGKPTPRLHGLVNAASAEDRAKEIGELLRTGFPTLWNGSIDVAKATAGQFDEHIRSNYEVQGSTVDKIAAFFLAAAADANIPISAYLKARKATAPSASSKKSNRQRKGDGDGTRSDADPPPPPPPPPPAAGKTPDAWIKARRGLCSAYRAESLDRGLGH